MREAPFSPEIQPFKKPVEVGDTNDIYYDPQFPDTLIRVPTDKEARFLETDTKLIADAEKIYSRLNTMGESLDIEVVPHQFILAKETSDGPVKPMLLAKRIKGSPFFPVDTDDPKVLEAMDRIAQLGLNYLDWIESDQPKYVVSDIFRPVQYMTHAGKSHDKLTLVDVEPRLKDREHGKQFVRHEISMLVAPLRDTEHNGTFNRFMHHAFRTLKQHRHDHPIAGLINAIVNAPEVYQQMSDDFLSESEPRTFSEEVNKRLRNAPLNIDRKLLRQFGIDKI